jgi:transposase
MADTAPATPSRRRSDRLKEGDQTILDRIAETNHEVYLGWPLLDQLRWVYLARDRDEALRSLDEWVFAACVSGLEPFVRIAITFDTRSEAIANARLEGMNSPVRLLSHRVRGFRITPRNDHPRLRPRPRLTTHLNT